jgi:hypothetical protein
MNVPTREHIARDLPGWPADVIDQWLLPYVLDCGFGWPPPSPLPPSNIWFRHLSNRPLSWWQQVEWEPRKLRITFDKLSPSDQHVILGIMKATYAGEVNEYSKLEQSAARIARAREFVATHGTFPRPILVMRRHDGLAIIDGCHRAIALLTTPASHVREWHSVWMADHPLGEVGL